jgi:Chaperone of endosialidase
MTTKSVLFGARRTNGPIALVRNSLGRSRRGFVLFPVAISPRSLLAIASLFAWFALSPARAVSPPPDGGYPIQNTAEGTDALLSLTTGINNTAIGFIALFSNTTGGNNTATGAVTLNSNTTGSNNTATGAGALSYNTTGDNNTANGFEALVHNTIGFSNTATGRRALFFNWAGSSNTAMGFNSLHGNQTGGSNTAMGVDSLFWNQTGSSNTATGRGALYSNISGGDNTAMGYNALPSNTIGGSNTAIGLNALLNNTTGGFNIALGQGAGSNLTTGNNNIAIGAFRAAGESNTMRLGRAGVQLRTFIAGIRGRVVPGGVGVIAGLDGQLGAVVSSARFKEAIKPMDEASEAILALKPVTFRYKRELDPEGIPQFGLVAEEVEKVNPDLVVRDGQGRVNSVRYEAVNAMLLNEFLKEHRKVQEVEAALARQQKDFAQQINALAASLKEQALQIQTLSSQHEAGKPVTSTAAGGGDFASKIPGGG